MSSIEVPPFLWSSNGDFDSPVEYVVPGSGEVQPYTATATYTNASGQSILPALRIRSSSGNLLALVFPSTDLADSDSAEVTFVPPFGSAAVSSPVVPVVAFSGASVYNSTAQSTSDSSQFTPSWNSAEYDQGGYHSATVHSSRLTLPADGWYRFTINVRWAANSTGYRFAGLSVNSGAFFAGVSGLAVTAPAETDLGLSRDVKLTAGSYAEVITNQTSGGNLNILGGAPTDFQVQKLG